MSFDELLCTKITSDDDYFNYVKALYDEWIARDKNGYPTFQRLGNYFEGLARDVPPHFFTGNIKAPVVIISLNSHSGEQNAREIDMRPYCKTWSDYRDFFTNFPQIRYSKEVAAKIPFLSNFDCKLHRFLSGNAAKPTREDLEKWNIFHVELCPIASHEFALKRQDQYICNYLLRTLEAIALYPRSLVLVINNRVCLLLNQMKTRQLLELNKQESIIPRQQSTIKLRRIDYSVELPSIQPIKIVAAPTFASQAISIDNLIVYGKNIISVKARNQALDL